ncbi:hypothetical protein ACU6RQ_09820 [Zobellella denitrificans]
MLNTFLDLKMAAAARAGLIGLVGLGLTACQGGNTANSAQPAPPAFSPYRFAAAEVSDPGVIQFRINPSGVGAYYGWQMQVTKAARNQGFKPFITEQLSAGASKEYALWPDRYAVNVYRLGKLEFSDWVEVVPGEITVVYADYGLLFDDIVISREPDPTRASPELDTRAWRTPVSASYGPEALFAHNGYRAEYTGPQNNGDRVGTGRVEITRHGQPFAEITHAEVTGDKITGETQYADGREVDGDYLNHSHQIEPGSTTTWPDGTRFTGSYRAFEPQQGELRMADGNVWRGPVSERKPAGQGRLIWWQGGWMDMPDGAAFPHQTGTFSCGGERVPAGECYYYGGKKLAGAEALAALMERDRQLAADRRREAESGPAAAAPVAEPAGCRAASGTFRDQTGNSTLRLDGPGQGNGSLVSYTEGGAAKYRFDIGFSFTTTADSMSVTYGNGTYSDAASGQVLQRMSAPSGTVPCRYDGRVLVFDGVEYYR